MSKWKTVNLGDIYEITSGGTPSKTRPEYYENGTIFWVKTGDLKGKYITATPSLITEAGLKNSSAKIFPVDTTLLAMYGATIGACSILKVEAATNQACAAFLPNKDIDASFFYYFLCSKREQFIKLGVGGAQPNISATILKKIKIYLPPLEEQKRIAAILDKASSLIDLRKQQLEKMDLLIKSKFIDMFGDPVTNPKGWEVKKLKDICTKLTDGTHFSPENLEKGQYKYVTAKNIKENGFDFTNISYVNEKVHREIFSRCNPEYGDILYIKDGVTAGIAQINTLNEEFSLLSSVALLKQNRKIVNKYYFREALNNNHMYDRIRENMGGAAITRLTIAKINVLRIPVPPTELQNQFAEFVEKVEKQKAVMQQSMEKMETNYKALMQEYFG